MPDSLPILALGLEYPLAYPGGVSVLVRELATQLSSSFQIVLISPDDPSALRDSELDGRYLAHVRWRPDAVNPRTARHFAHAVKETGTALAHFHCGGNYGWGMRRIGACPIPFLARLGVKCLTSVHLVVTLLEGYCDVQKPTWFKLALLPAAWIGKMHVLQHTSAEIAVSKHDERCLRRWYAPLRNRYRQIYHSRLHEAEPQLDAARQPVILNVGHLAPRKGQMLLTQAFTRIADRFPEWELHFAGSDEDGSVTAAIRNLAEKTRLSSRIRCLGGRTDARELMLRAGIYVQPSLEEALGLALQEALFAGCPSIGSTAGGIPELIHDGENGRIFPKGDVASLAALLSEYMQNAQLRDMFGRRGRASIMERGMTAEAMAERHRSLYAEVLHQPSSS